MCLGRNLTTMGIFQTFTDILNTKCWVRTWRIPFVVKSNAVESCPVPSIQLIIRCLWLSAKNVKYVS